MVTEPNNSGNENKPNSEGKNEEQMVTLSQEKLDSLINGKFKTGAEKANKDMLEALGVESIDDLKALVKAKKDREESDKSDLTKALEAIESAKGINDALLSKYEKLEETGKITALAAQNDIKDTDYFAFKYAQAKGADDFNLDTFLATFKTGHVQTPPKTDNTNNGGNPNYKGKDLKKMSISELKAYQATL